MWGRTRQADAWEKTWRHYGWLTALAMISLCPSSCLLSPFLLETWWARRQEFSPALNAACISLCFSRSSVIANISCTILLGEVFDPIVLCSHSTFSNTQQPVGSGPAFLNFGMCWLNYRSNYMQAGTCGPALCGRKSENERKGMWKIYHHILLKKDSKMQQLLYYNSGL